MKKVICCLLVCCFVLLGCDTNILVTSEDQKPDVCKNNAKSLIYSYIPNPAMADAILQIAWKKLPNQFSGENKVKFLEVSKIVLQNLNNLVDTQISYAKVFATLNDSTNYLNNYCGNEIITIVGVLLTNFEMDNTLISECDSYLLKTHIAHILVILKSVN